MFAPIAKSKWRSLAPHCPSADLSLTPPSRADTEIEQPGHNRLRLSGRVQLASLREQNHSRLFADGMPANSRRQSVESDRDRLAVYALPQNERSVARHLGIRQIESFLPTRSSTRRWKNGQQVSIARALFPTYLFVRIRHSEQSTVLRSPGVLRIVGNRQGPQPLPSFEIGFLRSDFCRQRVESYLGLIVGRKARIHCGSMQGCKEPWFGKNVACVS